MLNIRRRREKRKGVTGLTECWGNHDALLIRWRGQWWVGDAEPPVANMRSIQEYETDIAAGKIEVRWLWPNGAEKADGERAALYWVDQIKNRPYDYMAYFRLIAKCIFGDWIKRAAGWKWAFFCTEGVRESWMKSTHLDPWTGNQTPTPYTTEKRVESGQIEDWTALVDH